MQNDNRNRKPLLLVKNVTYPSYQLYAEVKNRKTMPEEALKICVLTALKWIRDKFGAFEVPKPLIYPNPEDYQSFDLSELRSFRIDEGYVVEAVYIPEIKNWTMQLVEPDLGLSSNAPVPGRIFTTNIGCCITNGIVQCGFQTMVSDPENVKTPSEVYRLGIIKQLVRNKLIGLWQCCEIIETAYPADTADKIRALKDLLEDDTRQMPVIVFTECCEQSTGPTSRDQNLGFDISPLDISSHFDPSAVPPPLSHLEVWENLDEELKKVSENPFSKKVKEKKITPQNLSKIKPADDKPDKDAFLPYKIDTLAHDMMGYAHTAIVSYNKLSEFRRLMSVDICCGDAILFSPKNFGEIQIFQYKKWKSNPNSLIMDLSKQLQNYPQNKPIRFGRVMFVTEARLYQLEQMKKSKQSKADLIKQHQDSEKAIHAMYADKLRLVAEEIALRDKRISKLLEEKALGEAKISDIRLEMKKIFEKQKAEIDRLSTKLDYINSLNSRPKTTNKVAAWVRANFDGKLLMHKRAIKELDDVPTENVDMKLLCDALEYLGTEYYEKIIGNITEETAQHRCSERYNRPFSVTPSGGSSIRFLPLNYKIKYDCADTTSKEVPLNLHLKVGNDADHLIRIYFFYDSAKKLIVIGSLPKHLPTFTQTT